VHATEVPRDVIYNMDEVGNGTSKRRSEGIADVDTMACMFQITPEGDGNMNMHVTACITPHADGKFPNPQLIGGGGPPRGGLCCCLYFPPFFTSSTGASLCL
jgi:hypothetical protein